MGTTIRTFTAAVMLAAAVTLPGTTPAAANADVEEGKVGLSVRGHGLTVQRAGGWLTGHRSGARARLYQVDHGLRTTLTSWRHAKPVTGGMEKLSAVPYWKLNRRFPAGSWVCIEFHGVDGSPCAQLHR